MTRSRGPGTTGRARKLTVGGAVALGVVVSVLVFGAPVASAAFVHEYKSQITGTPTGPGKAIVPFGQPWGLAFDSSNNLFVADANSQVIDTFDSTNTFTSQIGLGEFPEKYTRSVAVNNTTGVVYVAESGPEEVFVFKPEGSGKYQLLQKRKFSNFMYVAVNNSSGPRAGDVYVISGPSTIHVIKPNAKGELEEPGEELAAPAEGFSLLGGSNGGLAIDGASGRLYVANPGHGVVDEYDSNDVLQSQKLSVSGSFAPVGVAVDESNGEVYVLDAANRTVDEFSSAGASLGHIKGTPTPFTSPVAVAVKQAPGPGEVYVSDGTVVDVFGPDVVGVGPQKPVTEPASGLTVTTAVLHGELNPLSNAKTGWFFAYSSGNSCQGGSTTPVEAEVEGQAVKESMEVTGLEPATKYTFCIVAENTVGPEYGQPVSFETEGTAPLLQEARTSSVGSTEATVTASVNPEKQDTTCKVQYGETSAYGTEAPCEPADLGNTYTIVPATKTLTGLNPATIYHYRIVATNATGTTESTDETFTTLPQPPVVLTAGTEDATQTTATLTGNVNPQGGNAKWATTYYYQYGTNTSYTQRTSFGEAGQGNTPVPAPATVEGLQSGTIYHYRLVAENAGGTSYGTDQQFTTAGAPVVEGGGETSNLNPVLPPTVIVSFSEPVPQPLLAPPPFAFPATEETGLTTPRGLTNTQKLNNALKACRAKHSKKKRVSCEKQARQRYASTKSRRGKKK